MGLNFGSLATTEVSAAGNYMRAWNIYDNVKFDGIEGPTSGTSSNGNEWTRYELLFSCPEGTYKHSLFEPKSEERRPGQNGKELPSELEQAMNLLALVGTTFNPDGFDKVKAAASKVSSFEQLITVFKKAIGTPDTTTSMKLVGRNNGGTVYATMPNCTAISSKDGKCFIPSFCVFGPHDKLKFSQWEQDKKAEYESAKPTPIASTSTKSNDDDDLDSLLDL